MTELAFSVFGPFGNFLGTAVSFLLVLTVIVFVHEMGHFLVGRWCGIGVTAFSIGFGPELAGFTDRRGTRWKLCAIPMGGYVKFVGDMNAASQPDAQQMDVLTAEQRSVAFHMQAVWKRALTVFAGPAFNFLLTIAVFTVMFSIYGRLVVEPTVEKVSPDSPAAVAGFLPGDRFVSIDGSPVRTFADVQRHVRGRADDSIRFVVLRNGVEVALTATPRLEEIKDAMGNTVKIGAIGISSEAEEKRQLVSYSPVAAFGQAVLETGHIIASTGRFLNRLVQGREDKCQLLGPVKVASAAGQAARMGFEWVVQLVALLSVGIGILNLLPIPPLDGGHLLFYAMEAVKGRPVSVKAMEFVFRIGLVLVLSFMGFVFWNDLFGC